MKRAGKQGKTTKNPSQPIEDSSLKDNFARFYNLIMQRTFLYRCLLYLSPFIIYLIFDLILLGPPSLHALRRDIFNNTGDSQLIMWCLQWWPFSLIHLHNPFITHYIWNPQGYNLAWSTSVPSLALLLAPITLLTNAVVAYNILSIIALPLSALFCFYLVYYLTKNYWSALFSGCIFGFSSYQIGELAGHPSLYVTFCIPLIVLIFIIRLDQKLTRIAFILLSALALVIQFGISNEILATFAVFAIIALVLFYVYSNRERRSLLVATAIEFCIAGIVAAIVLIPYFYYMVIGYKTTPKIFNSTTEFSADLLNFIIPTTVTRIYGNTLSPLSSHFLGNYSEQGAYLGLPLIGILFAYVCLYWRKTYVRIMAAMLIIVTVASLGPILHIYGIPSIVLPWTIAHYIPILRSALPDRFTLYVSFIAAIMFGMWLSYRASTRLKIIKYILAGVVVISLLPSSLYSWQTQSVPQVFQAQYVGKYIKKNSNVLILPFGFAGSSMYYQTASGMWFTQSGGYLGFTPLNYQTSTLIEQAFYSDNPEPTFQEDLLAFCKANHVTKIIYTPDTMPLLKRALQNLPWPKEQVGNAVIITLHPQ